MVGMFDPEEKPKNDHFGVEEPSSARRLNLSWIILGAGLILIVILMSRSLFTGPDPVIELPEVVLFPTAAPTITPTPDAWDLVNRGDEALNSEDFASALDYYDRAIEADRDNIWSYYGKGQVYLAQKDYAEAIRWYSQVIEIRPNNSSAYIDRGYVYSLMGEEDKAFADYDKAVDLEPDNALAYNNRGDSYRLRGEFDKALKDTLRAIELAPDEPFYRLSLGDIYYDQGDWQRALEEYQYYQDNYENSAYSYVGFIPERLAELREKVASTR